METPAHKTDKTLVWSYTESFPCEPAIIHTAREAAEILGAQPVSAHAASLLTLLCASSRAENVLEIGTGTGVSTLALLQGLRAQAALSTLDIDSSRSQKARELVQRSGWEGDRRIRTIVGAAQRVLPRLSAQSYDLIFLDLIPELTEFCVYQALALLQQGGLLIVNDALNAGAVANPAQRDPVTAAHRRVLQDVQECRDDVFVSLLHARQGLYLVYKR